MKIPSDAVLSPDKIRGYLLVPRPANDKSKYLARAGFDQATAGLLESEIRRLSLENDAALDRVKEHGVYYNVLGSVMGPTGISLPVRLVWLLRLDGSFAFVTLVPEPGRP